MPNHQMRLISISLVWFLSAMGAGTVRANPSVEATLLNFNGEIYIMRQSGFREPASIGDKLFLGDKIVCKKNSRVVWVAKDGKMSSHKGEGQIVFKTTGPLVKQSSSLGRIQKLLSSLGLFGNPEKGDLSNIGGGIRPVNQQTFFILGPRLSYTREVSPLILWTRINEANRYRVRVASIDKDILEKEVQGPLPEYQPEDLMLSPGQLYFLYIEAIGKDGRRIAKDKTTFTVASIESAQTLARLSADLNQAAHVDRFSADLLIAELYFQKTFYADALLLYKKLLKERPQDKFLLGRIQQILKQIELPMTAFPQ